MADFTLDSFAGMLVAAAAAMPEVEHRALEKAGKIVQDEAKAEIGTYQGAAGPFAAWAPLKPATIARKAAGDTPLLETGEMRDSIGLIVEGHEAHVGSNDDKAVWQELGTVHIPPRSFLGGAAVRKSPAVAEAMAREIVGGVLVKQEMPQFINGARETIPLK